MGDHAQLSYNDERCKSGALIRCASGRVYEVVRREKTEQQNHGLLGGTIDAGLFVAISAPTVCTVCEKASPHSDAERGHIGWISAEQVVCSVLVPTPACPSSYEGAT